MQLSQQQHQISQVACGAEHSFTVTSNGDVYSWGINFKGQLGLQDYESRCRPTLVKNMSPVFQESGQLSKAMNAIKE